MNSILLICIIFVILFLTRVLIPLLQPPFNGGDVKAHLILIRTIKENNNRIPKYASEKYLFRSYFRYPVLYHWILSFFPEKALLPISKISGFIIDLLYSIIVYFTAAKFASEEVALYAVLLFVSIPQLVFLDNRAHSISPRPFGELLLVLSLVFLFVFFNTQNWIYFILSGLMGALVLLSSKGATQGLILFLIIISFFKQSLIPLGVIISSFIFAFLISRGHYVQILKSHITHLKFFLFMDKQNISKFHKSIIPRISFKGKSKREKRKLLIHFFTNNPIILVTINNPLFFSILIFLPFTTELNYLSIWYFSGLISYVLTSFKPFKILGGPDRYIEYISLPIALIGALFLPLKYIYILVLISCLVIFLNSLYLLLGRRKRIDGFIRNEELIDFLNTLPSSRILAIPIKPFGTYIGYRTKHKVLSWPSVFVDYIDFSIQKMKKLYPREWGRLDNDLIEVIKEFKINIIIIPNKNREGYLIPSSKLIYDKGYSVYKID